MTIIPLNRWSTANDRTGTTLRDWAKIINDNFELLSQKDASQDQAIANNTAKRSFPISDEDKLDWIQANAQVNTLNDIQQGQNIAIDKSDPLNPVISAIVDDAPISTVNWEVGDVVLDTSNIEPTEDRNYVTDTEKTSISDKYTQSEANALLDAKANIVDIIDILTSTNSSKILSANQGRVLNELIVSLSTRLDNIDTLLASDDTTIDEIQEIVDYIKQNRTDLEALGISNISGLQTSLNTLQTNIDTVQTNLTNHENDSSNPHSVTKAQVWLWNVDNTSDANKPISTAQQTALNNKANTSHTHLTEDITDFSQKVPLLNNNNETTDWDNSIEPWVYYANWNVINGPTWFNWFERGIVFQVDTGGIMPIVVQQVFDGWGWAMAVRRKHTTAWWSDWAIYSDQSQIDDILTSYTETSDLSTVATSGDYADLSNTPDPVDISWKANLIWGNNFSGFQNILWQLNLTSNTADLNLWNINGGVSATTIRMAKGGTLSSYIEWWRAWIKDGFIWMNENEDLIIQNDFATKDIRLEAPEGRVVVRSEARYSQESDMGNNPEDFVHKSYADKDRVEQFSGQFLLDPNEFNGWGALWQNDETVTTDLWNVWAAVTWVSWGFSFPFDIQPKRLTARHRNNNAIIHAWGWRINGQIKTDNSSARTDIEILREVVWTGATGIAPRDYGNTLMQRTDVDLSSSPIIPAWAVISIWMEAPTADWTNRYVQVPSGNFVYDRVS